MNRHMAAVPADGVPYAAVSIAAKVAYEHELPMPAAAAVGRAVAEAVLEAERGRADALAIAARIQAIHDTADGLEQSLEGYWWHRWALRQAAAWIRDHAPDLRCGPIPPPYTVTEE